MATKGETGRGQDKQNVFDVMYGEKNAMSAQVLKVSLLGVGTVLCLERDAWSMSDDVRRKQQMTTLPPVLGFV